MKPELTIDENDPWMTAPKVAKLLGFASGQTIIKWGGIPHLKIDRPNGRSSYRYRQSDVKRFLEEHTVGVA